MRKIDFIYRFSPEGSDHRQPATAEEARALLESGNRLFSRWVDSGRDDSASEADGSYIVQCSPFELGIPGLASKPEKQAPFAVLLGCADARVPAEMLFGQERNHLFVVRVAGNVLSDECLGSVEYAVAHMADSVRIIVVLGHTGCGAVTAAVDTYLHPWDYLAKVSSHALRSIVDRIFVPVRKAASALENIWGPEAPRMPGYREALIETAVFVNAAQASYSLRQAIADMDKPNIQVVYGVFDLLTHRIWSAPESDARAAAPDVCLADAPKTLQEFEELALRTGIRIARKTFAAARANRSASK